MRTEQWLNDLSLFVPKWIGQWEPAPGMLDFEEKWESFHNPTGRLMICAHRGDINIYYPENSLEGCYSAILAGADMLEVDVHTTVDGQLVIMHDDTLTRTTNVSMLREAGENWMPESDEIKDWTLEQIRRLRLITKQKELTEYAVPTLREVVHLAKNRVFVTLDKIDAFCWEDAYAIVQAEKAYRTVLIPYNYPLERVLEIENHVMRTTGWRMPFFGGVVQPGGIWSPEMMQRVSAFLKENNMPAVLRGGYSNFEDREWLEPIIAELSKNHRIYAESMGVKRDFPETWEMMLEMGYNIFMGNKLYEFLAIVKERHFT